MPRILNLIGSALLIASTGFSEVLITAQDYAVDSDVVLESAAREVKAIPVDTVSVVGDLIKFVKDETITAAKGIAAPFKEDPHARVQKRGELAVENAWDTSNDILFRDYNVSDEIGEVLMTAAGEATGPSVDVSDFFVNVTFPKKTSAYYMPKNGHLLVRQTMANILEIEDVLADYQDARRELMGHQVEVEAKFVEVGQKTLNELGFRWSFDGLGDALDAFGDPLDNRMKLLDNLYLPSQDIFNEALRTTATAIGSGVNPAAVMISKTAGGLRWNLFISALEQADDTDVLSAPRIVTRDGSTASIKVGEEQLFPQAFDVNSKQTGPFVEPIDWENQLMGVELEVTPELREGGLIDLEIIPKVKEFVGYDSYAVVPKNVGTGNKPTPATDTIHASLPYFRIREIETRVTVADGSTVAMGGLLYDKLETFRDKVPLLGSIPYIGRLFRSEGEVSTKRNLMIFVTATQVDVNGRRASVLALQK